MNFLNKKAAAITASIVLVLVVVFGGLAYAAASNNAIACTPASVTYNPDGSGTCTVDVTIPNLVSTATATTTVTATATATASPTTATPTPTQPTSTATTTPPAGGFPNGSNTGVPAGTTLTAYTGSCTITTANTVIDSKNVTCASGLTIRAPGVVIKNSKVVDGGSAINAVRVDTDSMPNNTAWSVTVQDSEVDGLGQTLSTGGDGGTVCCGNFHVIRSNIHGGQTAVQCDMDNFGSFCDVRDSWLHGQLDGGPIGTRHLGGFLSDGTAPKTGTSTVTLTHNTIACDHPVENGEGCTGDLNFIPHFSAVQNVTVDGNYFVANNFGSSYCTYGGTGNVEHSAQAKNIVYKNNVFQRKASGANGNTAPDGVPNQCGAYGPVNFFDITKPGAVWTNNLYDDGTVVAPAN